MLADPIWKAKALLTKRECFLQEHTANCRDLFYTSEEAAAFLSDLEVKRWQIRFVCLTLQLLMQSLE